MEALSTRNRASVACSVCGIQYEVSKRLAREISAERVEPRCVRHRKRHRDARVALIRCGGCCEYYETSVRQSRRIRKGEARRLCPVCRNLESAFDCTPDNTADYVRWWAEESGLSAAELREISSMVFPEEARSGESVPYPSRRLPSEEGNHTTLHDPDSRIRLVGNGQPITATNAA